MSFDRFEVFAEIDGEEESREFSVEVAAHDYMERLAEQATGQYGIRRRAA